MKIIFQFIRGRATILIAFVIILIFVFMSGCGGPSASSEPIQVRISFSDSPTLGKPVQLTASYSIHSSYKHDAHNVIAKIILPDGFEKVSGDIEWQGDIIQGTPQSLIATVKSIKTCDCEITANAFFDPSSSEHIGGSVTIYISVYENYSVVYDRPPFHFTRTVVYPLPSTFGSPTFRP
jgi:hypothetical protein